jgi:hypothetical protein
MCAVNYLNQCVMEESILDVELLDQPIPGKSKGHDDVNYHGLHNGAESLVIIDIETLREPAKNPMGLVPLECPVGFELVLEDPLAYDNIGVTGVRNQVPSVVGHESSVFFLHSRPPMRIGEGGPN